MEPRSLHKDWEKKTKFGQFDLSLYFYYNWSYKLNFEVILFGPEIIHFQ